MPPRKRSKKVDKVPSQVDVAWLDSIEELSLLGEPFGDEYVELLGYQYRLNISTEFPLLSVAPTTLPDYKPCGVGLEYVESFDETTVDGLLLTARWYHISDVPHLIAEAAMALHDYAHTNSTKPRNLILTLGVLRATKEQLAELLLLDPECHEFPVTYDPATRTVTNYYPQPAKEPK